jgi:hypothetical protein
LQTKRGWGGCGNEKDEKERNAEEKLSWACLSGINHFSEGKNPLDC